jgi:outer membrane protein TolC
MRLRFAWAGAALVVAPIVGAQGITEDEFLSGFGAESPAVRVLTEGVAQAEAARKRASLLSNPRADFWREQPDANPRVTNWTFSWTPPLDGRYGLGKKSAEAGLAAAQERLAVDKAGLRRELRSAFAGWSLETERQALLAGQIERVRTLASAERERARVGEESGLAARRFALAEAEVRAAWATAQATRAKAEAMARAWRPNLASGAVPAPVVLPDPPASADPTTTPELRALAHEVERAEIDRKRAGRFLTFPTLQLGWQQLSELNVVRSGPILAAGWTIPLFDRDQPARIEAERRQQIAAARVELQRARVSAEIEGGLAAYRTLLAGARDASRASEESDRVITAATAAYRAGESSLTDLLDSLRATLATRMAEIDLRERALQAHRELEAALGRPLVGGGF